MRIDLDPATPVEVAGDRASPSAGSPRRPTCGSRTRSRRSRSSSTTATCRSPSRRWRERLTERGAGLRRTSTWPSSTGGRSGCWSAPGSSRRTRTPATCAPSACCPPAAGAGSATALLRDCFARVPARRPRGRAAARRRRERDRRAAALRVGRDAAGAGDRRLGQGRPGRLTQRPTDRGEPPLDEHLQDAAADGALLPAYVDHDSLLTIGSRDRDASPTTAAVTSGSTSTSPSTSSHGTSRKWSGSGSALGGRGARPGPGRAGQRECDRDAGHEPDRGAQRRRRPGRSCRRTPRRPPAGSAARHRRRPSWRSRAARRRARGTSRSGCRRAPARRRSRPSTQQDDPESRRW